MGFLVEKATAEMLEIKCFCLQYGKSFPPQPWVADINCLLFLGKVEGWRALCRRVNFSAPLEDDDIKVHFSTLT